MDIRRRIAIELVAARKTLWWFDGNNNVHKAALVILILVWAFIEIGTTFTAATPPESMNWIRAAIVALVFREHGRNVEREKMKGSGDETEK